MTDHTTIQEGIGDSRRAQLALLCLALATPLVFARGLLFPFVIPRAFLFQAAVAVGLALLAVDWLRGRGLPASGGGWGLRDDFFLKALLAFVFVAGIAAVLGQAPSRSLLGTLERRWGVLTWASFAGFYLLLRSRLDGREWLRVVQISVGVGTAVALYGLARGAGMWPTGGSAPGWDRMTSTLGNAGYVAACLTVTLALTGYLAVRRGIGRKRWLWLGAAGLQTAAILLSGTRAVVLGWGVATLVLCATWIATASSRKVRWVAGGGVVALGALGAAALLLGADAAPHGPSWWDRLLSVASTETSSARLRLVVWGAALDGIREAPLLGVGPENFDLVWSQHFDPRMYNISRIVAFDRAHNVLVGTAATMGLTGLLAYVATLGAVGWGIRRAWQRGALVGVEASVLAAGGIAYLVHLIFWFEDLSSFMMFVVLAGLVWHLASGGGVPVGAGAPRRGEGGSRPDAPVEGRAGPARRVPAPGTKGPGSTTVRCAGALLLLSLAALLAWHNVRVLGVARSAWNGEYSLDAWDGAEVYQAALAPDLPGSGPVLNAYLRRLTFLAGRAGEDAPRGPSPRMERALDAADRALSAWAARDPQNPQVFVQRARFCGIRQELHRGDGGEGCTVASLRRAIELSPGQIRLRHSLARQHLAAGEPDRALRVLREALGVYEAFGETYHYVARVHRQTGDMVEAVRQARVAISLGYGAQPAPFVLELVDWLEEEEGPAEAADFLESHLAVRYGDLARPELRRPAGAGLKPWDVPLASRLALLHWLADRPEEAVRTARFLARRLGVEAAGTDDPRGARIRRFIEDVRAGRREGWRGVAGVLTGAGSEPASVGEGRVPASGGGEEGRR